VIATLTVGRSDGRHPFDEDDMAALALVSPVAVLAVSGSLQRLELEQGSPRDAQTGLYNRAYLDAALDQLLALRRRMAPPDRPPLSMIMFDIDSFRLLNDRHGRQVGDAVLRAVSTMLRQRFRASDILARVGPDSFFVVLNGANAEIAADAAAQIRRQVRELNVSNARGEPVIVSISAGCAMFHDGDRPDALFRSVEAALDTARWSGPGAVVSI
jgi:diguanylate cyclase